MNHLVYLIPMAAWTLGLLFVRQFLSCGLDKRNGGRGAVGKTILPSGAAMPRLSLCHAAAGFGIVREPVRRAFLSVVLAAPLSAAGPAGHDAGAPERSAEGDPLPEDGPEEEDEPVTKAWLALLAGKILFAVLLLVALIWYLHAVQSTFYGPTRTITRQLLES